MKVIFIHKPTGFYVGGSVFNKTCGFYKCRDKMIEKGISEDKANMLIDIIGPYRKTIHGRKATKRMGQSMGTDFRRSGKEW